MAIRFVDVEPGQGGKAGAARRPRASAAAPEPAPVDEAPAPQADAPVGDEAPLPGLPHAKPEPKARGRKKPPSSAGPDRPRAEAAAPLLQGLLPEIQAHAKPTPKPRGRKKAFG